MSTLSFVSCVCPTYNRAPNYLYLVEEAIESFLRQDYPADRRELVILNDCPTQELRPEVPCTQLPDGSWTWHNVRYVNHPTRFASLGEKRNAGTTYSTGGLICPWDDDDISLPWRISQGVEAMMTGTDKVRWDYWKPPQVWFLDQHGLHWNHNVGVRHHASIFTREAWERAGGYPLVSGNEDALMDQRLGGHLLPSFPQGIPPEEWAYVYRWGVSSTHISSRLPHDAFYKRLGEMPVEQGTFTLHPHWRADYVALTREALARR